MSQASTPSQAITDAQIGKLFDHFRPEVRRIGLSGPDFQTLILEKEKDLRLKTRFRKWLQDVVAQATNTIVVVAK